MPYNIASPQFMFLQKKRSRASKGPESRLNPEGEPNLFWRCRPREGRSLGFRQPSLLFRGCNVDLLYPNAVFLSSVRAVDCDGAVEAM